MFPVSLSINYAVSDLSLLFKCFENDAPAIKRRCVKYPDVESLNLAVTRQVPREDPRREASHVRRRSMGALHGLPAGQVLLTETERTDEK
jgi:hypothetical protein